MCSVTAIDKLTENLDLTSKACLALCSTIGASVPVLAVLYLISWNDAPGRTQAEVVATFRKAAQAEREAGR